MYKFANLKHAWLLLILTLMSGAVYANGPLGSKDNPYVFSAPPRESVERGEEIYGPIAEALTRATGKHFIYWHPGEKDWLTYTSKMRNGDYDMIFDGPHFVGWRTNLINHTPVLALQHEHVWVVIGTRDAHKYKRRPINKLGDLAGRRVCVHAPPNFGTLTLLSLFDNPVRQPTLIPIAGWKNAFLGVRDGKCEGAILPKGKYKKFKKKLDSADMYVTKLYQHRPYPNQAITVGPRIKESLRKKIVEVLQSDVGMNATAKLRKRFNKDKPFKKVANKRVYDKPALVLRDFMGFEYDPKAVAAANHVKQVAATDKNK